jgi:hypothetical protein
MRAPNVAVVVVLAAALLVAGAPVVHATTYTLTPQVGSTGSWSDSGDWSPEGGPPGAGDVAIIPAGKTVEINQENEHESVGKISVGSGSPGGVIRIDPGTSLTIIHDAGLGSSVLDGQLLFSGASSPPGELRISGDVTIVGEGLIRGSSVTTGLTPGLIVSVGQNDSLTLDDPDLEVRGAIEIQVPLVNNALVSVSDTGGNGDTLSLTTTPKSGSGKWQVLFGKLQVDVEVTGTADWEVQRGGEIEINAACTALQGNVEVGTLEKGGLLDVNANFATSGNLVIQGQGGELGYVYGEIDVADGVVARFAWCPSCVG